MGEFPTLRAFSGQNSRPSCCPQPTAMPSSPASLDISVPPVDLTCTSLQTSLHTSLPGSLAPSSLHGWLLTSQISTLRHLLREASQRARPSAGRAAAALIPLLTLKPHQTDRALWGQVMCRVVYTAC